MTENTQECSVHHVKTTKINEEYKDISHTSEQENKNDAFYEGNPQVENVYNVSDNYSIKRNASIKGLKKFRQNEERRDKNLNLNKRRKFTETDFVGIKHKKLNTITNEPIEVFITDNHEDSVKMENISNMFIDDSFSLSSDGSIEENSMNSFIKNIDKDNEYKKVCKINTQLNYGYRNVEIEHKAVLNMEQNVKQESFPEKRNRKVTFAVLGDNLEHNTNTIESILKATVSGKDSNPIEKQKIEIVRLLNIDEEGLVYLDFDFDE